MANLAPAKPHTAGIVSALVSLFGVIAVATPAVAQYIPPKYAWIVAVAGIVGQAVTKPVHAGSTDLVEAQPQP